jgi:Ca2+-binding EF-hand superfamily protein
MLGYQGDEIEEAPVKKNDAAPAKADDAPANAAKPDDAAAKPDDKPADDGAPKGPVADIPEKTAEEKKKALADNPIGLKEHLKKYSATFSKDIDELWKAQDSDGNGFLTKDESKKFMESLVECIDAGKKAFYDPSKFDEHFKQFDLDNDSFLSKSEMAVFIKKAFNKNNPVMAVPEKTKEEKLKALADNPLSLKEYLKDYCKTVSFSKDIDTLWKDRDLDGNGYLDKEEAKLFLMDVTLCIDQNRRAFYDPKKFDDYFT